MSLIGFRKKLLVKILQVVVHIFFGGKLSCCCHLTKSRIISPQQTQKRLTFAARMALNSNSFFFSLITRSLRNWRPILCQSFFRWCFFILILRFTIILIARFSTIWTPFKGSSTLVFFAWGSSTFFRLSSTMKFFTAKLSKVGQLTTLGTVAVGRCTFEDEDAGWSRSSPPPERYWAVRLMAESLEFTAATEETTLLTEEGSLKARALEVREGDFSTVTLPLDDSCREHSRAIAMLSLRIILILTICLKTWKVIHDFSCQSNVLSTTHEILMDDTVKLVELHIRTFIEKVDKIQKCNLWYIMK